MRSAFQRPDVLFAQPTHGHDQRRSATTHPKPHDEAPPPKQAVAVTAVLLLARMSRAAHWIEQPCVRKKPNAHKDLNNDFDRTLTDWDLEANSRSCPSAICRSRGGLLN